MFWKISFVFLIFLIQVCHNFDDRTPINVLENRLKKNILEPSDGQGVQLLLDAFKYQLILEDVLDMLDSNKMEDGMKLLKEIGPEGPQYFKLEHNLMCLQEVYKWNEDDSEEFEMYIIDAKKIWDKLKSKFGNKIT